LFNQQLKTVGTHRLLRKLYDSSHCRTYYHDHLEEIRQQIRESEAFVRELQAKTPDKVQQKLRGQNIGKYRISL
jgi:hypothetical protein